MSGRKALGAMLIASPFVATFVMMSLRSGVPVTLGIFCAVFGAVGAMGLGLYLLTARTNP